MKSRSLVLVSALSACACGSEAAPPDGAAFRSLLEANWRLEPGEERFVCVRVTPERDLFVRSLRSIAPTGTHHTVLMTGGAGGPDGEFDCGSGTFVLGAGLVFASGLATRPLDLPDHVALRIPAGEPLTLNLHLFNTSPSPLEGLSRVEALELPAENVESEADIVLAGKTTGLVVPPGPSTQVGQCTMAADATLVSLWPHMHRLGTHLRVVAETAGGDVTLLDRAYAFGEQQYDVVDPFAVRAGERLRIECTYDNPGLDTAGFGESSQDEMCFAGIVRYPRPPLTVSAICSR